MPSSATLTAQEFNSAGAVVPAPVLDWLSLNTGVFTVPINGSGGQTAVVTATGVGSANGTCTDPATTVSGNFTVNVATSLGLVVVPPGVALTGTLAALAGGGSGLSVVAIRMRFLVDCLLGTPTASNFAIVGSGIQNCGVGLSSPGTLEFIGTFNGGTANAVVGTMAQASLPVAGTGVIMLVAYASSGAGAIALLLDSGAVLFTGSIAAPTGNTNPATTGISIGGGTSGAGGMTIDGAEILTAIPSSPQTPPLPTDSGALGIWGFAGVLTPTVIGATLAPSSGSVTYLSGGIWS
jgi:hypothetical protein